MDIGKMFAFIKSAPAVPRTYLFLKDDHVYPGLTGVFEEEDKTYIRIWLNSMYLSEKRRLWKNFIPAAHVYCRLNYGGKYTEVPVVIARTQIEGLEGAGDRMVDLNHRVIGPVPFNGGEVELVTALFAVKCKDYAAEFISVLSGISDLTANQEMKIALQFVEPIKKGLEGLTGIGGDKNMHLAIHDTFALDRAPRQLVPGCGVIIDIPDGTLPGDNLWIREGRLYSGPTMESAKPFTDADYLVFSLECLNTRKDWTSISSIYDLFQEAIRQAASGKITEADLAFTTFKGLVMGSTDLIHTDRVRLVYLLQERMTEAKRISALPSIHIDAKPHINTDINSVLSIKEAQRIPREQILALTWH